MHRDEVKPHPLAVRNTCITLSSDYLELTVIPVDSG